MVKENKKLSIFWFRRDLRLDDNSGLYEALKYAKESGCYVQPLFIFDSLILDSLDKPIDFRMPFLHECIEALNKQLKEYHCHLWVYQGKPIEIFKKLFEQYDISGVYSNEDYEPYAHKRDAAIAQLAHKKNVHFQQFKDQVIFSKEDILNNQNKPYTVYTAYKNKWMSQLTELSWQKRDSLSYCQYLNPRAAHVSIPSLSTLGFAQLPGFSYPSKTISSAVLKHYDQLRDFPAEKRGTSHLGIHLRFGTLSIRLAVKAAMKLNKTWLSELIWREFFMQILWHFPHVETQPFKSHMASIKWRKSPADFEKWCTGQTGYPLVDAGMRQLNATGYMHNRVRMVAASFLCKHLLIHWLEGERYFARKLLDYDLAANNGNWQWVAGTGCDAAPYFRIFNPLEQAKKFDPDEQYVAKWVPELHTDAYPPMMVEHRFARERALAAYHR